MGIKINCKIKGLKKLDKKLNDIAKRLPETVEKSVEEIVKNTCKYAIRLRQGNKNNEILFEMVNTDTKEIKGRIYTDQQNFTDSWFEYFETEQYAEVPHVGKSNHFIENGYEAWVIPVNKVKNALNYPIITIQGQQFYLAYGVQPNLFMQKAEFEIRGKNLYIMQKGIYKMLKEVTNY